MKIDFTRVLSFCLCVCLSTVLLAQGESTTSKQAGAQDKEADKPAPIKFTVAKGNLSFAGSGTWKKIQPRINMIEAEFKIPKSEGDAADGRMTIMRAGGGVEANVQRWQSQFVGDSKFKRTETKVAGQKVHWVDIKGNFMEGMGGPFGPKTKRENYRMLGVIIETAANGLYFIKLTGPQKTIDANKKHFDDLVKSLKVAD